MLCYLTSAVRILAAVGDASMQASDTKQQTQAIAIGHTDPAPFGVVHVLDAKTSDIFEAIVQLSVRTVVSHCPHILFREPMHPTLHRYMSKLTALRKSPFSITLLLDGDTMVLDPTILSYEHFDALLGDAEYGIVVYNEQTLGRDRALQVSQEFPYAPRIERYGNAGVLVVRQRGVVRLCDAWLETYLDMCRAHNRERMWDEPALNVVLQTVLADKTAWLPKPYNVRAISDQTKIAHFFGYQMDEKLRHMQELCEQRGL